jgi:hypothetical protein
LGEVILAEVDAGRATHFDLREAMEGYAGTPFSVDVKAALVAPPGAFA